MCDRFFKSFLIYFWWNWKDVRWKTLRIVIHLQIAFYLWLKCQVTLDTASAHNILVHRINSFKYCRGVHFIILLFHYFYLTLVIIRLHTKNQSPRLPGSNLKCNGTKCGVVVVLWWCGGGDVVWWCGLFPR